MSLKGIFFVSLCFGLSVGFGCVCAGLDISASSLFGFAAIIFIENILETLSNLHK